MVTAGLEVDVEFSTFRKLACLPQREDLRVWLAGTRMVALTNDPGRIDDYSPDHRVGAGFPTLREAQCLLHEMAIGQTHQRA